MALFFIEGHASAAGFSANPSVIQWAVDRDSTTQQVEIQNTGPREQTCQLSLSNVTGGKNGAVFALLRLKSDTAEITLAGRQKRIVNLQLDGGLKCPAGLYQAMLTLKPSFGAGAETKVPIQVRVYPRLIIAVDTAPTVENLPQGFETIARFYVEASVPKVQFFVAASPLIYQNPAKGEKIPPIPLNLAQGVQIIPQNAEPGGAASRVYFQHSAQLVGQFPMLNTQSLWLSDTPYFAQPVYVTVQWKLAESNQPVGTYVGQVELCGLVMPE
jgi:hypothetical protein